MRHYSTILGLRAWSIVRRPVWRWIVGIGAFYSCLQLVAHQFAERLVSIFDALYPWWYVPILIIALCVLLKAGYELWKEEEEARKKAEAQVEESSDARKRLEEENKELRQRLTERSSSLAPRTAGIVDEGEDNIITDNVIEGADVGTHLKGKRALAARNRSVRPQAASPTDAHEADAEPATKKAVEEFKKQQRELEAGE